MVLYINACVRDESRTDRLAKELLGRLGDYTELKLSEDNLKPLDKGTLEYRSELIAKGQFDNDMFKYARQFADALELLVGKEYWPFPTYADLIFEV